MKSKKINGVSEELTDADVYDHTNDKLNIAYSE